MKIPVLVGFEDNNPAIHLALHRVLVEISAVVVLLCLVDEGFLTLVVDVGVGAEIKLWRHGAGGGREKWGGWWGG